MLRGCWQLGSTHQPAKPAYQPLARTKRHWRCDISCQLRSGRADNDNAKSAVAGVCGRVANQCEGRYGYSIAPAQAVYVWHPLPPPYHPPPPLSCPLAPGCAIHRCLYLVTLIILHTPLTLHYRWGISGASITRPGTYHPLVSLRELWIKYGCGLPRQRTRLGRLRGS